MAIEVVQRLSELLNEEKWTRATLNNYIIKNFTDLDLIIKQGINDSKLSEIRDICSEHLKHTSNSIIALYVLGKLNFEEEALDEGHIQKLINLFIDNKRFNIVEFLAKETLKYGDNKYALKALAQIMTNDNREDELIPIWERLVKIDYEEADVTRKLASIKEKDGKIEESVDYYKKALLRYIKKGAYNPIEEIWLKLVDLIPEDLNFFLNTEKKIADSMGEEKASFLLSFIVPYYKENKEYNKAIDIIKKIFTYNPKNKEARGDLIECYNNKYKDHTYLKDYLKISGLIDYDVDIYKAVDTFEKHIVFDVGNYVYHRTWGIGICREIKDEHLIIDFKNKPKHSMSLQMALPCLQVLPEDHIWLLKIKDKDKLKELMRSDVEKGLRILIKSNNNKATAKDFKKVLLDGIFTKKDWTKWWNKAKIELKKNPYFGTLPDKNDVFFIRKNPIAYDEDIYNRFKNEKNYNKRFKLFNEFIAQANGEIDSEYFEDMLKYFTGFISSINNINENALKSFLLLKYLKKTYKYLPIDFTYDFSDILEYLKDIHTYLPLIPDNEQKKNFLVNIKKYADNWPDIFIRSFYECPLKFIFDELIQSGFYDRVNDIISNVFSHYREYTETYIWIVKNLVDKDIDPKIKIDYDQVFMGLTHLLEISNRELINERNVIYNRRIFNTIVNILFKDNLLIKYIKSSDISRIKRLLPTIPNMRDLKDEYIIKMRYAIKKAHPEIVFEDEIESINTSGKLITTQRSYELKQNELKYLIEIEVPSNSKEIGKAIEMGDLSENAEYKYAIEKQEFIKRQVKILTDNLNKAQILKPEEVKTNIVSIGTTITLNNIEDDKIENYTILGPWESDPSKKIVSYTSPFGETLLNKSVGDIVELGLKNIKKKSKILRIEKALF